MELHIIFSSYKMSSDGIRDVAGTRFGPGKSAVLPGTRYRPFVAVPGTGYLLFYLKLIFLLVSTNKLQPINFLI